MRKLRKLGKRPIKNPVASGAGACLLKDYLHIFSRTYALPR